MAFPQDIKLPVHDSTNDRIWHYLQESTKPLEDLCPSKFSIPKIIDEINTGCSPCPDILTGGFGKKPSVLFVSTVYGLINKYLKKNFERSENYWKDFVIEFYDKLIIPNKGIYGRLGKVYDQVSSTWNNDPEFCFTELVKTVLVDENNKVSGLESQGSFVKYFINNELAFLRERLSKIEDKCIVFTFSEVPTFYTMTSLVGIDPMSVSAVPEEFEIICGKKSEMKFESKKRSENKIQISISSSGETFSKSIAFNTLLKMKDRDIFVLPLPHPSGANNRNWPKERWAKLETLIGLTK